MLIFLKNICYNIGKLNISINKIMNDVNTQQPINQTQPERDQNVFSFMLQLVQEKFGDDTDLTFQNQEAERLYDLFGNNLVSYFEPMLSEQQKIQFDNLYKQGSDNQALLGFLTQSIPDLEMKIMQILVAFRNAYLAQPAYPQQANPMMPNPQMAPQMPPQMPPQQTQPQMPNPQMAPQEQPTPPQG